MRIIVSFVLLLSTTAAFSQKKPVDHTVYDGWQSIVERNISNDGKYIAFTVNPQEGDGTLLIKTSQGESTAIIARGYGMTFSNNSKFLICKIKPLYAEIREARIKKKRPDQFPKDSLAIVELLSSKITKIARIKSFKIPDESGNYMAYLLEKILPITPITGMELDSAARLNAMGFRADSLIRLADSIRNKVNEVKMNGMGVLQLAKKGMGNLPKTPQDALEEGTNLVLVNLITAESKTYPLVSEYYFNKKGDVLLLKTTPKIGDSKIKSSVVKVDLSKGNSSNIFVGYNDAKGFAMDEDGKQLAFLAERDSSVKSLQQFYQLYYHMDGMDSAKLLANKNTNGIPIGSTIGEFSTIRFSKSGKRLFFGISPILPIKDTVTPEFERVNVDIWGPKDDYIQPIQLKNLPNDLKKSNLARFDFNTQSVIQIGSSAFGRGIQLTEEGDGSHFYGFADEGKRIAIQWQGYALNDIYEIDPETGFKKMILKNFKGNAMPSYTGKYVLLYDEVKRNFVAYNASLQKMVTIGKDIKVALYNEENDVPDDPKAYGVMGWTDNDEFVLIYDMYDIWKIDPTGIIPSVCLTGGLGRKLKLTFRNIVLDKDEPYIKNGQPLLLSVFNNTNKGTGLKGYIMGDIFTVKGLNSYPFKLANVIKAKDASVYSFSTENYQQSPNIKVSMGIDSSSILKGINLYQPNLQQANYIWGTAELFKWKAYTGKETEGILYKPENFDPAKKYPMIVYFYERNAGTLYNYQAPAPTPSRLNIPFFVSRGYIVFVPDIWYKIGYPGKSGYDYIVSGTRALIKKGYIDSTKIGLQGQSWGGFQIVYLITKTNLFAAAWAGAPVANMTSAYGGIRWGSGMNRQFQYEKTQSRIGATLWEKPELYIENSALFSLPKVKTPLVIMANDADDAVPWYQGIEMYTGMRRLGKTVWMLNYNNEAHNLIERKNRKDIQIREQQFFDYYLKGEQPAKWISEGVPALMKGRDWGLGY